MPTPIRPSTYLPESPGDGRRSSHTRLLAALLLPLLLTDLGCRTLPNPQKPREEAQTQRGNCHNEAQKPAVASSHPYPGRPKVCPHTLMFPRRQLQSKCSLAPCSHTTRTTRHNCALTNTHTPRPPKHLLATTDDLGARVGIDSYGPTAEQNPRRTADLATARTSTHRVFSLCARLVAGNKLRLQEQTPVNLFAKSSRAGRGGVGVEGGGVARNARVSARGESGRRGLVSPPPPGPFTPLLVTAPSSSSIS
jgi:hypothetical protein